MNQLADRAMRPRDGASTRAHALRVALALFTEQGYDATSLRQIAEALGINKASLYYHFANKEAILRAAFDQRGTEIEELIAWVDRQEQNRALIRAAVLRWIDGFSEEKLQGIRFLRANPFIGRTVDAAEGGRIGTGLRTLSDRLVALLPGSEPDDEVLLRMAVLSINAAVEAAIGTDASDAQIILAARAAADSVLRGALGL